MQNPKDNFQIYEAVYFFYKHRNEPSFRVKIEDMKSNLKAVKERFIGLVSDIAVLLEGDSENPRYTEAFTRYQRSYSDFSPKELFDYCRFICSTFEITMPRNTAVRTSMGYVPSQKVKEMIENRNYPF